MPTIAIYDAITGETVQREMNAEELAQYEADKAAAPVYEEAPASDDAGATSTDADTTPVADEGDTAP